jgi:uncharacterized protein
VAVFRLTVAVEQIKRYREEHQWLWEPGLTYIDNVYVFLIVCHCERESGYSIRIISARKATKNEAKVYKGGRS